MEKREYKECFSCEGFFDDPDDGAECGGCGNWFCNECWENMGDFCDKCEREDEYSEWS